MGSILDFLNLFAKYAATHKKELIKGTAKVALAGTALYATYRWTKHMDKKVFDKMQEQHDIDTARRLTDEFQKKYVALEKKAEESNIKEQQLKRSIITLCNEFEIDPNIVLP